MKEAEMSNDVVCMGETRNAYKILVNFKESDSLRRLETVFESILM
jgi:hypothetical protein